jgi:acyl carrier protein
MDKATISEAVVKAITTVAPDISPAEVEPDTDLRAELDLDSMDFLNIVVALHEALQVDIPEADYPQLTTLSAFTDYLAGKLG